MTHLGVGSDQAGYATQKAIIISKAMRKVTNLIGRERISLIFTNQLRTRLGVSFGDPWEFLAFDEPYRIDKNANLTQKNETISL